MQSLNIVLTKSYIYYQSPDLSIEESILEVNQSGSDVIAHFSELLNELSLPRDTSLNLILDNCFISYFYFNLPPVNRRKLDKILQYELSDVLIDDLDNYFYEYRYNNQSDEETQIGIFLVKKELVNQFLQIGKSCNLEIRSILSLEDLLDFKMRDKYAPDCEIVVTGDRYDTNLIVYKHGFVVGFSNQSMTTVSETPEVADLKAEMNLKDLNWRIKAIELKDKEISSIRLSEESSYYLAINENSELYTQTSDRNGVPTALCSTLFNGVQLNRSKQINLLKSNFFILQEIKSHIKKIVLLAILLGCGGIFFVSSSIYQNVKNGERYLALERVYSDTVKNYLPEDPSSKNAPDILRKKIAELKEQRLENEKFVKREYRITRQLNELSQLKKQISSLSLTRFFLTEQAIRIQGEVATFAEYDQMKNSLQKLYSQNYQLRYNQKSVGEDRISFTVTIRPNK